MVVISAVETLIYLELRGLHAFYSFIILSALFCFEQLLQILNKRIGVIIITFNLALKGGYFVSPSG